MSGDVARANTGPATQHTKHKATPAAGPAKPGTHGDSLTLSSQPAQAKPGLPGDSLTLSSHAAQEKPPTTAPKAAESAAAESGDRLDLSPRAIEMLATTEDTTLKYTLSDRWSHSARQIFNPRHQPQLRGGTVLKGEYSLSESTTLFGGAGYLPRFSAHDGGHAKPMPPGGGDMPAGHAMSGTMPGDEPMGTMPGDEPMGTMPGEEPMGAMPGDEPMGTMPGEDPMGAMPAGSSMGGERRGSSGRIVGFVGVRDFRGTAWDLGKGFRLDATAHSEAMLAIAGGHGGLDAKASRDLSAASTSGALTVTRDFQNFTVKGGYGAHLDLLKTYDFATGKEDHFPLINYLHAGVEGKAGEVAYRLNGYLPLGKVPEHSGPHGLWVDPAPGIVPLPGATAGVGGGPAHGPAATRGFGFVSTPLVRAEVGMPGRAYVPDLALVASPNGFERVELSKSWALSERWDATVMAAYDFGPGNREANWSGGVGLRYSFGGGKSSLRATSIKSETRHSH